MARDPGRPAGTGEASEALRQLEDQGLSRLKEYLDTFTKFERVIQLIMRRKYPPEQILEAEGRKCVLSVAGLRFHEVTLYFVISQLSVKVSPPFEGYDTFVQAPLSVINELLARVLSGEKGAFGDVLASGQGRIVGPHAPHDMMVWESVFDELAANIARTR